MRFNSFLLFSIFLYLMQGCSASSEYKDTMLKEEMRTDLNASNNPILQKPAIEIVNVSAENFEIDNLTIPDKETIKRVKILGAELHDVIALLTEATDQNIIFQLQSDALSQYTQSNNQTNTNPNNQSNTNNKQGNSNNNQQYENNDEYQIRQSKVYVSASNIGFGRLLKKSVGDKLSIRYDDNTYYLGYVKTVTVKVPALTGLVDILKEELSTLGAVNVLHDTITSTVTFSAREKEYLDIMNYLEILRNNLYVIEYDIAIYNVDLKDQYSLGINWNIIAESGGFGLFSSTASALTAGGAAVPSASFGAVFDSGGITGSMIADVLSQFGKVESIQRPKLLGMAGTDVTLIDGLQEPYIKEIKTTAVGDTGVQTSTVSETALSGLEITLNSNMMDGTVMTNIALEINDIVGYTDFEVDGIKYSQPRTHTKNIVNDMRVKPGVPIVISGLFRHKTDKGYKGIPGLVQTSARLLGGTEFESVSKSEMVIIVTPRVIKYVIQ